MAIFIDRRLNAKGRSTVNRQRFMRRYKSQIKESITDAVTKRSVTDVNSGESVVIPTKDISEPVFAHGVGGNSEKVFVGNDQFAEGDRIEKPKQNAAPNASNGDGASSDAESDKDGFIFNLSKDEYLNLIFEDLELPNMKETSQKKHFTYKFNRAGFASTGSASNLNIVRSFKSAISRRIAMSSVKKRRLSGLMQRLEEMNSNPNISFHEIEEVRKEIQALKKSINAVPFLDSFDLRYNNFIKKPILSNSAVMFCLMDVSGSMDQVTKDIAKRFYILLYLFLTRSYKDLEIVFIRHHTQAKEVNEQDFFYSQETGGTIVSSALEMMYKVQQKRFPSDKWNIYVAQASDGDNWADDSPLCKKILQNKILPLVRYYSYIEITNRSHQTLWGEYESLLQSQSNFNLQHIRDVNDIYPVFREIFKKQNPGANV